MKRYTPQTSSQDFRTFLDELDEASIVQAEGRHDWLASAQRSGDSEQQSRAYNIQRASDAREKISFRRRASDAGTNHGVRIWNGKSADVPESPIEKDFTTYSGTPGRLYCPFASSNKRSSLGNAPMTNGVNGVNGHRTPRGSSVSRGSISGRRSKRSSFHDPIRAEICGFDDPNSGAPSVEGSAPLCPIRFLDQHSPEEVAQYFEKHKHELPRSHEICVKRYQSNEASIRELDQKYGSLVTMIQGLGQVHQPMLPETPEDEPDQNDAGANPNDRVERWATTVAGSLQGISGAVDGNVEHDEAVDEEEEDRQPHFDRPLKDVRVGESPSRPWGITVPDIVGDGEAAKSDHTASPRETPIPQMVDIPAKGKCPFDHKAMKMGGVAGLMPVGASKPEMPIPSSLQPETGHPLPTPQVAPATSKPLHPLPKIPQPVTATASGQPAQIVFNGPVFFGYNMEQAMAMLQQINLGQSQGS